MTDAHPVILDLTLVTVRKSDPRFQKVAARTFRFSEEATNTANNGA